MSDTEVLVPNTGTALAPSPDKVPMPATGAMATNPALTVASVMAVVAFIFNLLVGMGYIQPLSPEMRALFDEHGVEIAGAAIAVYIWIGGWITRNHVVAPATLARLVPSLVRIKR